MSTPATVSGDRPPLHRLAGVYGLSALLLFGQTAPLLANPTGGAVVAGGATIGAAGKTLTITQSTSNAIINWQTFSIASGETTKFLVPGSSAATLNYVLGGNPSAIYGTLSSNGRLFLINPSGILVGPSGRIDTAGFLGSTLNANNSEFLSGGNLQFSGNSTASIVNQGSINASNGNVFLIASQVSNAGSITAPQGGVGLAAGSNVLLQQDGDQHLFVQSNPVGTTRAVGVSNAGTIQAASAELRAAGGNAYALAINNSGAIAATGYKKINGQVFLTADTGAINNSGTIHASGSALGGTVKLTSKTGNITNSGVIDVSATAPGGQGGIVVLKTTQGTASNVGVIAARGGTAGGGGVVEVSGASVNVGDGVVDTLAPGGGTTGNFIIDPSTLTIASTGGNETGAEVDSQLATSDVTLNADTAVTINDSITWTSANSLTISTNNSGSTVAINQPISGVNGSLVINTAGATDQITTGANGSVNVNSFVLQNGYWNQNSATLPAFTASTNFQIQNSATFLRVTGGDGSTDNPYQITDIYGLEGLGSPSNALLTANAELMNNIDLSSAANWHGGEGWTPIGSWDDINSSDANTYSGVFNGNGFTISNLTIDSPDAGFSGLFGDTSGASTIEDLNLTNVDIIGNYYAGGLVGVNNATVYGCTSAGSVTGNNIVGGLLGINAGAVTLSSSSGAVNGNSTSSDIGGLVGYVQFGSITECSSSANVLTGAASNTSDIGGLVGVNYATITNSSSSGNVSGGALVGGLVGSNAGGTIGGGYSSSNVTGATDVGGLVGTNNGQIVGTYATGAVIGTTTVGGLVGANSSGSIQDSYAVGSASGSSNVGGLAGSNAGTIENAYSLASVSGSSSNIGGLIGDNVYGTIIDSYAAGPVMASGANATALGGLTGTDLGGTYTNAFWDTTTAGVGTAFGSSSAPTVTGVYGATTTNLMSQAYISNAGTGSPAWDFNAVWTTNGDTTLPQLLGLGGPGAPNTGGSGPDSISGTAFTDSGVTDSPDATITFIYDGVVLGTTSADSSGAFSYNITPTNVSTGLLLTDAGDHGATYFQSNSSASSFTGVDIWGSTLRIDADTASNSALKTTVGSLSGNGINFTVNSSNNLSTNSGVSLNIVSNYTIDGNLTAAGAFLAGGDSNLTGSTNATLQGTSVNIQGGLDDTGALTVNSTSGAIDFQGVGSLGLPAQVCGLTLNATGPVIIDDSYITLPGGDFYASGTGYASSNDANGDPNGIDLNDTNILLSGGNLTLNGTAGYVATEGGVSSGYGVNIQSDGSTQVELATTGNGNITINGTGDQAISSNGAVEGVYIHEDTPGSTNNYIAVQDGNLTINGTVNGTSANGTDINGASITGVGVGAGTQVVATGAGSVTITGDTSAVTTTITGGNFSGIVGVDIAGQVGVTSGVLNITGHAGTLNTTNSTISSDNEGSDGGNNPPTTIGVLVENDGESPVNLLSGSGSTVTINGTGGAVVTSGAYTGESAGVIFASNSSVDFGTAPTAPSISGINQLVATPELTNNSSGSTVTITGHGGAVNAGNGSHARDAQSDGVVIAGSVTEEDGGSLTITGYGGALNISQAAPVSSSTSNFTLTQGVRVSGGAVIAALGDSSLTLNGTGGTITAGADKVAGSVGINIGNDNEVSTLTVQNGALTLSGTGGSSPDFGVGVILHGTNSGQVVLQGSPTTEGGDFPQIIINGTGGSGYTGNGSIVGNSIPDAGVILADNITISTPYDISITGAGGTNSPAVMLANLSGDTVLDTEPVSAELSGNNISIVSTTGGLLVNAGISALNTLTITSPSTITLLDTGDTGGFSAPNIAISAQGAVLIDNSIFGSGTDSIVSANGDITLEANAEINVDGTTSLGEDEESVPNVLTVAAGTNLPHSHYIINHSSLGSSAITATDGALFYLYQADSKTNTLGGITVPEGNVQYGVTYPDSSLPSGDGELFYVANANDVGPNPPGSITSLLPINLQNLAALDDGSGSNLVPVSTVPQNGDVQTPGGDLPGIWNGSSTPPFSFTGGASNQTGGPGAGLASSAGNGGLVGAGDAALLGGGTLTNIPNPAVYSVLGPALSPQVYLSLTAALDLDNGGYYPADGQPASAGGGTNETTVGAGDVVVMQNGQVNPVAAGQVPAPLQKALGPGALNNMPGH